MMALTLFPNLFWYYLVFWPFYRHIKLKDYFFFSSCPIMTDFLLSSISSQPLWSWRGTSVNSWTPWWALSLLCWHLTYVNSSPSTAGYQGQLRIQPLSTLWRCCLVLVFVSTNCWCSNCAQIFVSWRCCLRFCHSPDNTRQDFKAWILRIKGALWWPCSIRHTAYCVTTLS